MTRSEFPRFVRLLLLAALLLCQSAWSEVLRVGISPDYEPLAFKKDGEVVGIEADNAAAVAKLMNRDLQLVELSFQELIPALQEGRIDVIMSGFSVTAARKELVSFAQPHMEVGQMAIVRIADAGRLTYPAAIFREGVRLCVEPGTTGERLVRERVPQEQVQYCADAKEAFDALEQGRVDVYVHDAPTSWRLANSGDHPDLISLYRPLNTESLAWAARKGDQGMVQRLNAALKEMTRNGHLKAIKNYWIPVTVQVQ